MDFTAQQVYGGVTEIAAINSIFDSGSWMNSGGEVQ